MLDDAFQFIAGRASVPLLGFSYETEVLERNAHKKSSGEIGMPWTAAACEISVFIYVRKIEAERDGTSPLSGAFFSKLNEPFTVQIA